MRCARNSAAWGLLAAVLMAALSPSTGRAATTRPHPLFGNPVLGNSAEIATMWPAGTGGVDSLRITDFIRLPNPGWLSPRPPDACPGGPTDPKYQQLDVATGDFDGDGRDDVVAAYSLATADPWRQRVVLEVPDIRSGPLDWISGVSDTQGHVAIERNAYRSPSNIRLATGNFDSDEDQEFVLGTRVQRNFHGTIGSNDWFGWSVAAIGDVDGDGVGDLAVSAHGDDDGGTDRGAVWILFLRSDGTVHGQQKISDTQGGFTGVLDNGDQFGVSIAAIGDLTGDGIPDIAVGADRDDDGGTDRGAVWLLHLNRDGTVKFHVKISSAEAPLWGKLDNSDHFGLRLCSLGDLNNDGVDDLAVSAPWDDDGGSDRGAVYLLMLNWFGVEQYFKISDTENTPPLFGLDNGDNLGYSIAYFPDFDHYGQKALAVGAPGDDDGGSNRGAVWLMFLNPNGTVDHHAKISDTQIGLDNGDSFGKGAAALPDLDEDNVCELAVGADYDDDGGSDRGAVYIICLNASGVVKTKRKISSTASEFGGTLNNGDRFGCSVACPGDLDGNGAADLVVGALADDTGGQDAGCVFFIYLGTSQDQELVKGEMENGMWWDGMLELKLMALDGSRHPVTLASCFGQRQDDALKESTRFDIAAGDFDGDGIDEIAVGGVRRKVNSNMEVFVTIYAYSAGTLIEWVTSSYGDVSQGNNTNGQGDYIDHVAIATGHLRPALTDQILFSWSKRQAQWVIAGGMPCLRMDTYADLATLIVSSNPWEITGWGDDRKTESIQDDIVVCAFPSDDEEFTGPSLGVAVGDLTGDGLDEVAWAALNKVYLYQWNDELQERRSINRAKGMTVPGPFGSEYQDCVYNDPSRRVVEIADLDAYATATEWRPEVIVQDWGAAGWTQKIRVYRADSDGSGVITGLVPRDSLLETQVPMNEGDVALVCGDFDGDGVRFGVPTGPKEITEAVHPSIIVGTPPVHFDVFDQPYDLTGCYPPVPPEQDPDYACTDFNAVYSIESSTTFACSTSVRSDWGLSIELKRWAEGFGARVENRLKATYGEHFARTGAETHTYTVSEHTVTGGVDRILADVTTYSLWEYPVMDGGNPAGYVAVIEPGSMMPTHGWYTYDTWAGLTGAQAPVITHEPGNILSYSKLIPQTGDYGEQWKADLAGWEVGSAGAVAEAVQACEAPHCFDLYWTDISGSSVAKSWEGGFEVGLTASASGGDPLGIVKAGLSVDVEGKYESSELNTHSVTVSEGIHLGATLGNLSGTVDAPYMVYPYVYRSSTAGTLVLDYTVEPLGVENWWYRDDRYGLNPDFTFILPRLHRIEKGFELDDPATAYRSPDVRIVPNRVLVGDTVTVQAIVRNYSLVPSPAATVRFFVGDPEGEHMPIYDIHGVGEFTTSGGIPVRQGLPVTIQWIVPSWVPETPAGVRVYAQVDPDDAVAEVHEYNNKAYALLWATGGNPVDVPAQVAGVPFRLEQSVPNPFRNAATIAFGLPEKTQVTLNVYDIAGRLITTLVDEELAPGRHEVRWDGRGRDGSAVRPGIYLYRIKAGVYGETRRIVRLN